MDKWAGGLVVVEACVVCVCMYTQLGTSSSKQVYCVGLEVVTPQPGTGVEAGRVVHTTQDTSGQLRHTHTYIHK